MREELSEDEKALLDQIIATLLLNRRFEKDGIEENELDKAHFNEEFEEDEIGGQV